MPIAMSELVSQNIVPKNGVKINEKADKIHQNIPVKMTRNLQALRGRVSDRRQGILAKSTAGIYEQNNFPSKYIFSRGIGNFLVLKLATVRLETTLL